MKFSVNFEFKKERVVEGAGSFGAEIIEDVNMIFEARNYATATRIVKNIIGSSDNIEDYNIVCIDD